MDNQISQEIGYLQKIDLFDDVSTDQLKKILSDADRVTYQEDERIFFQGDKADNCFVLLEGSLKLSQVTPEGDQVVLHYVKTGGAFGIIAVLREIDYPVTAHVVKDSIVLKWEWETMKQWFFDEPQIGLNAIRILSKYVLNFQDQIRELATERVERRVARALLRLVQQSGEKTEKGVQINLKLTRQDIAEMTGTTLFSVSRIMRKWEEEKIVDGTGEHILILAPHEVVRIAEDLPE